VSQTVMMGLVKMHLRSAVLLMLFLLVMRNISFAHATQYPKVTSPPGKISYADDSSADGGKIEHGELITNIDNARKLLHAQHHSLSPVARLSLPTKYSKSEISSVEDYALSLDELVLVHPGPGEYVHVMEGKRHGYNNLSVGITNTEPGGSPPMHTHPGEESHVLLEGTIKYAVKDKQFIVTAPYIMHIPPMIPHSFRNEGEKVARIVVIFPTNIWEYDVLDYFPFGKQ